MNTFGRGHAEAIAEDAPAALERHHIVAMAHQKTAAFCSQRGLLYVPMVFAAQRRVGRRAGAVPHQITAEAPGPKA